MENNYRAVHWTIYDGLSQGRNDIALKDLNGFLWVGSSSGLNRFDGNIFKTYYHDPHSVRTISGDFIRGMVEDSLHNIWVGTENGLSRYDIKADTFTNFLGTAGSYSDGPVTPFWATRDEIYSFESGVDTILSQISVINIHSFAVKRLIKLTVKDSVFEGLNGSNSIYESNSNSVWLLWGRDNSARAGLLNVSLSDGEKQSFEWPCYRKIPGHSHVSEGMCFDRRRNSIWINSNDGLLEFTLADRQFHPVDAMRNLVKLKEYARGNGIDLDLRGRVWVATNPKGILVYDPSNHSLIVPFPEDSFMQHEVSDSNSLIYCDRDGFIWSGFWQPRGFYQIIPFSPVVRSYMHDPKNPHSLRSNWVLGILNAGHGKLWIETIHGGPDINIFDTKTGAFNFLNIHNIQGAKGNKYLSLYNIDTVSGKAWVESDGGFFEIDLNTKKSRQITFIDSVNKPVRPAPAQFNFHLPYKNVWLTIFHFGYRTSIFILQKNSDTAKEIINIPKYPINVFWTASDDDHFIFLKGKRGSNLTYTFQNNIWKRIPHPMDSIQWTCIYFNKKDTSYWVAAERKLIHYDKDFIRLQTYTQDNGLPRFTISSIIADGHGNIWFHDDRVIHQLNIKTGEISVLSENDGYQKHALEGIQFNQIDDNGNIYFPGGYMDNGFYRVYPDNYSNPTSIVYLQSLEVNHIPVQLSTGLSYLNELSLSHSESNITIATGIIDYYSKGSSQIRYKLEENGNNVKWQYAPANYVIRFENLQPGKYKLRMQASNAALQFGGPEKVLIFQISPAYWNTWWFRTMSVLCIAMIFYILIRWRLKEKFRLQLERSEKERQLSEMRHKTGELEMQALRAQMNPHFIFNSLNSINRFIMQNNKSQASEFLTKFSKLVRLILQNSQVTLITLESELESLELYLELEALRFDYHFIYKISFPPDLDISALKVPPLIIQPYVENAIWHGLMHNAYQGQLDIEVSQDENHLFFKIRDNGIGRKQARALASKSATKHKSLGLRITADRIGMSQKSNGSDSPVTINDLVNADGSAAGTEVIIKIPVAYD